MPDDADLSDAEWKFFCSVQEKLEWTAIDLPAEDRHYGWVDHAEFVEWVRRERERLLSNAPG